MSCMPLFEKVRMIGRSELKFLDNISHYYNNIFTFHMHMFIIYILGLNKLNITIHSNNIYTHLEFC
jgi:hypothetical protein